MSRDRPILAATFSPRSLPPLQRVSSTLVKNSLFGVAQNLWVLPNPIESSVILDIFITEHFEGDMGLVQKPFYEWSRVSTQLCYFEPNWFSESFGSSKWILLTWLLEDMQFFVEFDVFLELMGCLDMVHYAFWRSSAPNGAPSLYFKQKVLTKFLFSNSKLQEIHFYRWNLLDTLI